MLLSSRPSSSAAGRSSSCCCCYTAILLLSAALAVLVPSPVHGGVVTSALSDPLLLTLPITLEECLLRTSSPLSELQRRLCGAALALALLRDGEDEPQDTQQDSEMLRSRLEQPPELLLPPTAKRQDMSHVFFRFGRRHLK